MLLDKLAITGMRQQYRDRLRSLDLYSLTLRRGNYLLRQPVQARELGSVLVSKLGVLSITLLLITGLYFAA